jgi:hypothetical protein
MARGRMISKSITKSKQVHDLPDDTCRLAFTWAIALLDCEGRMEGDPALVRNLIFPRRTDVTVEQMEQYIQSWVNAGLAVHYESGGDWWLFFPGFERHQVGLRREKEAPSRIPPPPPETFPEPAPTESPPPGPTPDNTLAPGTGEIEPEPVQIRDGAGPELIRSDDGKSPPEIKEKLKGKGSRREDYLGAASAAPPELDFPEPGQLTNPPKSAEEHKQRVIAALQGYDDRRDNAPWLSWLGDSEFWKRQREEIRRIGYLVEQCTGLSPPATDDKKVLGGWASGCDALLKECGNDFGLLTSALEAGMARLRQERKNGGGVALKGPRSVLFMISDYRAQKRREDDKTPTPDDADYYSR